MSSVTSSRPASRTTTAGSRPATGLNHARGLRGVKGRFTFQSYGDSLLPKDDDSLAAIVEAASESEAPERMLYRRYFFPVAPNEDDSNTPFTFHYDTAILGVNNPISKRRRNDFLTFYYMDFIQRADYHFMENITQNPIYKFDMQELRHWANSLVPRTPVDCTPLLSLCQGLLNALLQREITLINENVDATRRELELRRGVEEAEITKYNDLKERVHLYEKHVEEARAELQENEKRRKQRRRSSILGTLPVDSQQALKEELESQFNNMVVTMAKEREAHHKESLQIKAKIHEATKEKEVLRRKALRAKEEQKGLALEQISLMAEKMSKEENGFSERNMDAFLNHVCVTISRFTSARDAFVGEVRNALLPSTFQALKETPRNGEEQKAIRVVMALNDKVIGHELEMGTGLSWTVVQEKKSIHVNWIPSDPRVVFLDEEIDIDDEDTPVTGGCCVCPIMYGNKVVAVLGADTMHSNGETLNAVDLKFIENVADKLGRTYELASVARTRMLWRSIRTSQDFADWRTRGKRAKSKWMQTLGDMATKRLANDFVLKWKADTVQAMREREEQRLTITQAAENKVEEGKRLLDDMRDQLSACGRKDLEEIKVYRVAPHVVHQVWGAVLLLINAVSWDTFKKASWAELRLRIGDGTKIFEKLAKFDATNDFECKAKEKYSAITTIIDGLDAGRASEASTALLLLFAYVQLALDVRQAKIEAIETVKRLDKEDEDRKNARPVVQ
eukprot:Rmarinus@m.28943